MGAKGCILSALRYLTLEPIASLTTEVLVGLLGHAMMVCDGWRALDSEWVGQGRLKESSVDYVVMAQADLTPWERQEKGREREMKRAHKDRLR